MAITSQLQVTNNVVRRHFGQSEMFNNIAQYDVSAANQYRELVSSEEYIERPDIESKPTYSKLSEEQKKRILFRLRHPYLVEGYCLVCLEEVDESKYCCSRCKKVAVTLMKEYDCVEKSK